MSNEVVGALKHLYLASEDVWGRNPFDASGSGSASQSYIFVPCTNFDVRARPQSRQSQAYIGIFQQKHSKNFRAAVQGNISCALHGFKPSGLSTSLAEYLMTWAFGNHESQLLPSKTAKFAQGPNIDNREVNGLRVNSATLQGSADSGTCELSMDVMGCNEQYNATSVAVPNDMNKLVDFDYKDCSFQLNGSTVLLESFQLQIQHGLVMRFNNSYFPSLLVKTQRLVTLQMILAKNSNTYSGYRRSTTPTEITGQMILKGLHNGTHGSGTYAQAQIDFARLSFMDADEQGGRDALTDEVLNFVCLKPDSSTNEMAVSWSWT